MEIKERVNVVGPHVQRGRIVMVFTQGHVKRYTIRLINGEFLYNIPRERLRSVIHGERF